MRLISLLCGLTLLLAGCAASHGDATLAPYHHQPTVLQWGVVGLSDVPTLDPALASDPASISVASLVYGGLVRLDSHMRVQPDGATHWKITHGGTVYTFSLRHNLRFPDGRRVTAHDFAAALDRALGSEGSVGTASFYLGLITQHSAIHNGETRTSRGIAVLNPTTLRITLEHPAAHFLAELAFPASYVPDPTILARYGASWTDHAAGFGPFVVQTWRHGRYLTLVRNPHYYGKTPPFRRISLHFYQGQTSAMAAYRAGRLDLVSGLQAGQNLAHSPTGVRTTPALALDYLAFNTTRLPFQRVDVRRAFAAVNVSKLVSATMRGAAFPAHGFMPPAFNISSRGPSRVRQGSAYLARAHYPGGKSFPHISLITPRDPYVFALAHRLADAWQSSLGVDVTVHQLNSSNYATVLNAHAFDLALVRWGADYPDPQDFLGTQLGSSSYNVTGWSTPAYDHLLNLADSYDPADSRRISLFRAAAKIASDQLPIVPLDEPTLTAVIRPDLRGVQLTPLGTIAGDWTRVRFTS